MRQPQIVRSLLTSALQLWLRSLVTQAKTLNIDIHANDRQLLKGHIPQVFVEAEETVYRGLHLSQLTLNATHIRVNLGQILRGKPVQLLNPIVVGVQAWISAAHLNHSLDSDLLSSATNTLAELLLPQTPLQIAHLDLKPEQLILWGTPIAPRERGPEGAAPSIALSTQVTGQASTLCFSAVQLLAHPAYASQNLPHALPDRLLPLGDVVLERLAITADAIALKGEIKVLP